MNRLQKRPTLDAEVHAVSARPNPKRALRAAWLAVVLSAAAVLTACATLEEIAALRNVDFALTGATGGTLAGVPIQSMRSYRELSAVDVARVAAAIARRELPVETELLVTASNPAGNVAARLVRLDWTLFLDDQETVSGVLDREFVLAAGASQNVPVRVSLDLLDFFDRQLEQVVDLALALAGRGEPQRVRLEATPSIETPIGPIRYPSPIPIEYEVGAVER
jgi:hypothetical protein